MIAVPMCPRQKVVAVFGMASTAARAFHREDVAWLVAQVLSPYVAKFLQFSTRHTEMQHVVNEIISPLASEISQCMSGEGEPFSAAALRRPKAPPKQSRFDPSRQRKPTTDLEISPDTDVTSELSRRPDLNFCVPSYSKKSARFSFDHVCSTDINLNWADVASNLINLFVVYVAFSRVAVQGQTYLAILICLFIAAFDIILLRLCWTWLDRPTGQGGCVVFACQLYRMVIVPVANTWMSWRVLNNLDYQPDFSDVIFLAILLVLCIFTGSQVRSLLHMTLQILSIVFAVFSTPAVCHRFDPLPSYPIICLGSISAARMLMASLIPALMHQTMTPERGATFMPHLQVKRLSRE